MIVATCLAIFCLLWAAFYLMVERYFRVNGVLEPGDWAIISLIAYMLAFFVLEVGIIIYRSI